VQWKFAKNCRQVKSFRLQRVTFVTAKVTKTTCARTRADAVKLHRCPALLGRSGTAPKLASLRHGRLFGRFALRCSARFMAQQVKGESYGTARATAKQRHEATAKQRHDQRTITSPRNLLLLVTHLQPAVSSR
jgi:hypothetical protein